MSENLEPNKSLINSKKAEPLDFEPVNKENPTKNEENQLLLEEKSGLESHPMYIQTKEKIKKEKQKAYRGLYKVWEKVEKADNKLEMRERYERFIKDARAIINDYGIDRVVIHGNPITDERINLWEKEEINKDGKPILPEKFKLKNAPPVEIKPDFDVNGALYLLEQAHKLNPNIYNEGILIESIPKGDTKTNEPFRRKKEVIIYFDAGNSNPRIEDDGVTIKIFADHHGIGNPYNTSATKISYDIFKPTISKNKEINQEAQLLVKCATKFDNIEFIEDKNRANKKYWNESFFIKDYPRSLYSLAKVLPFEKTLEILKNPKKYKFSGTSTNWLTAFSQKEIEEGELGKLKVKIQNPKNRTKSREINIKQYIQEVSYENLAGVEGIKIAKKYMKDHGIDENSYFMGKKVIFHNFPEIEIIKNGKKTKSINTIPQNVAFLAAKSLGYNGIIFYNPKQGTIFFNTDGKGEMMALWEKVNQKIPGYPKPVRNTFMFPPKDQKLIEKSKEITEEEWLDILGMKTEKYTKVKNYEEIKKKRESLENEVKALDEELISLNNKIIK